MNFWIIVGIIIVSIIVVRKNLAELTKRKQKKLEKICTKIDHDWDGCKCFRCGKVRDEQHDWEGCICNRCGKDRHDWGDCECKRCGKVHDWIGCKCIRCGQEHHDWGEGGAHYHDVAGGHGGCTIYYYCNKCGAMKSEDTM
ncbi:MAG: hypothetical protein LBI15_09525 [Dysgonamonadaceae bacterium]|jgi:hypothetical protein|nr:hypothetical protein [Dysgonamonadaceae bacterium]